MFSVGLHDVDVLVRGISGIDDGELVKRRFKYLQRSSFPSGTNTGRGRKASFDLDQLLQILTVFELIQIGSPPTRAIRIVRTNWPELRPSMALGWLCAVKPVVAPIRNLLVMGAGAFQDAGGAEDPAVPVSAPFKPMAAVDFLAWTPGGSSATRVVLDPTRLAADILLVAADSENDLERDAFDAAFLEFWQETQDLDPEEWVEVAIGKGTLQRVEDRIAEETGHARRRQDGD